MKILLMVQANLFNKEDFATIFVLIIITTNKVISLVKSLFFYINCTVHLLYISLLTHTAATSKIHKLFYIHLMCIIFDTVVLGSKKFYIQIFHYTIKGL